MRTLLAVLAVTGCSQPADTCTTGATFEQPRIVNGLDKPD